MNGLNQQIELAGKFTAAPEGVPATDHSQQMAYGLGMAAHFAQQAAVQPEPPQALKPIVPIAN